MLISEIFKASNIKIDLSSQTKEELFEELVNFLCDCENFENREEILSKIWERENKMSTGIAPHIAIPHTSLNGLTKTVGVLGISRNGIEYESLDGKPVHLVMLLVGNDNNPAGHLNVLKNIAMLLKDPGFYPDIYKCKNAEELNTVIASYEEKINR
jgi:PTS system fructose-specific IIC component/PTS system nitrogen regulatory IIA component